MVVLPAVLAAGRAGAAAPAAVAAGGRAPHRRRSARRPGERAEPPPRARRRRPLRVVRRASWAWSRRSRYVSLQHAAHRASGPQGGLEVGIQGAALRRAAGARTARWRRSTSRASPTRARRASARHARCAAPEILNSCELGRARAVRARLPGHARRRSARASSTCSQRVRARHPGVQVAAVSIRGERDDLRALVRRHGWRFPVAWDRDGSLANLFGVAVCPQLTYALPGGVVQATSVGDARRRRARPRGSRALERESRGMRSGAVSGADPALEEGWVDRELALEFPDAAARLGARAGARAAHAERAARAPGAAGRPLSRRRVR